MNNLKILISDNTKNLFDYSIEQLSNFVNNIDYNNIIIVPDKLSLCAEQAIFDKLNVDVYFNITVMGIAKFANYILKTNNLNYIQCTSFEAKLLTLRAIQNVSPKFKCFSQKYTLGFVDEIYAKIEQIKSSNCKIEDLIDPNASVGTKLKFDDIKLIYDEYMHLLNGKLDGNECLALFNKTCNTSEYLKKANVFFVGFDSLTKQGLEILKNVAINSNYAQISVVASKNKNSHIYDQSFLDSVIRIAKQEKIECEAEWLELPLKNKQANFALTNLFAFKKNNLTEKQTDCFYKICEATSKLEEIELCVKQINYMLKINPDLRFDDFAICANADYQKLIYGKLQNLNIDVYCDTKYNLFELEPIKYVYNLFTYSLKKDDAILPQILTNDFCDLTVYKKQNFYLDIIKFGTLNNLKKFANIDDEEILQYIDFLDNLKKSEKNYIENLNKILDNSKIFEKIAQKCEIFNKNGDIYLEKIYVQIQDKICNMIKTLREVIDCENLDVDEIIKLLQKSLMETEIMSVPSTTNQVYLGDYTSFYFDKKYIFILGLNEGSLPAVLNDSGLITDKEIMSETIIAQLEPTTKIINKRNKFKLFEILLSANNACFMYFHSFDNDNKKAIKSEFVSEVEKLFCINAVQSNKLKIVQDEKRLNIKKICYNAIDAYNANLYANKNISQRVKGLLNFSLLKSKCLQLKIKKNNYKINFSKLFFKNNKTSISIIEKYNACPKSAFLSKGLRLSPIKKNKIESNVIGDFIHRVGERFVKENKNLLGKIDGEKLNVIVEEIMEKVIKDEEFYTLLLPENIFLLKLLKKEGLRFCEFVNYEQSISDFKATYTEKYFGGNSEFLPIELDVDEEKYFVSGFVDRIDVCENNFRVIDYKTGKTTNSKGMENLFYGTKIQLFVYAKAICDNMEKKFFGAFYLPINNGFSKDSAEQYQFSGFFEDSPQMVMLCDKNMSPDNPKSELLNVSFAKLDSSGELRLKKKSNIMSDENLHACLKYSLELVKQSIKDINSGFMECSPIKDRCKICEYNNCCKNAFNEDIERAENYDVSNKIFMGMNYGEGSKKDN